MTLQAYSGLKGTRYSVGPEIGRGGEGAVFGVKEDASLVLKVYTEALDQEKAGKLQYMASVQDADLLRFAAWPLDVIRDANRQVCGFVMKKLEGFVPLHMLFSPIDRKRLFPDKGYNFLVHVARNLATAFHKLHQLDIVMGDVNEANILVNASGMVALIDCDSFQIKNGNHYYFCEVGIPRYTPPELLELGSFNQVVRTVDTDSFSLATLIFQLLFLGRPPFTGINRTHEEIDEEKAIKTREFAYSLRRTNKKLNPARHSFELQNLTPGLIDLFHQAFEGSTANRPAPKQWVAELEAFGKTLVTCQHSKIHQYPQIIPYCPWCRFRDQAGIIYFFDDAYLKSIPELHDIDQFINGFKLDNIRIKKLSENYKVGDLSPISIAGKYKKAVILHWFIILALLFITAELVNYNYVSGTMILIIAIVRFWISSPFIKGVKAELLRRKEVFQTFKDHFNALIEKHNHPADLSRYNHTATQLGRLISDYKNLPTDFSSVRKKIEEQYYDAHYQIFLKQFDIRQYPIPAFGPAKKTLLYNNGIRTAADVSKLSSIKIKGIGPANIQVLQSWQRQIGASFTYIPDVNLMNRDLLVARNEIGLKKRKLEASIKTEYQSLYNLKTSIQASVNALEHQYHAMAEKVYQADLDYNAFRRMVKWWSFK